MFYFRSLWFPHVSRFSLSFFSSILCFSSIFFLCLFLPLSLYLFLALYLPFSFSVPGLDHCLYNRETGRCYSTVRCTLISLFSQTMAATKRNAGLTSAVPRATLNDEELVRTCPLITILHHRHSASTANKPRRNVFIPTRARESYRGV